MGIALASTLAFHELSISGFEFFDSSRFHPTHTVLAGATWSLRGTGEVEGERRARALGDSPIKTPVAHQLNGWLRGKS